MGPALALVAVLAFPFIGRAVNTSDGAEVVSESLGLFVSGHFGYAPLPSGQARPEHSKYGLFPSLLPLPFLAVTWPFRETLGAGVLDAAVALTWEVGTLLAALGFLRLVRVFRPAASAFWAAGFVAGTFLWPYAADSFVEPWSAACLAAGAALLLSHGGRPWRVYAAALLWASGALLKPVLWLTAPVFLLAAILVTVRESRRMLLSAAAAAGLGTALAAVLLTNLMRFGSALEIGYGEEAGRFVTPLADGLSGLLLLPGRSLFLFAPIVLVALFAIRRLSAPAALLCFAAPLVILLAIARWHSWAGGAAWGPRLLLPVLPLLAAPASLLEIRVPSVAFALGGLVNLPGVLVAPGAFIGYAEQLRPTGTGWPERGSERVSVVPALTPVYGHFWLFGHALGDVRLPALWLGAGRGSAREMAPPPSPAECVSPWIVRRALRLPSVRPVIPRLLLRVAAGYAFRGDAANGCRWAREAKGLSPSDPDASRVMEGCR